VARAGERGPLTANGIYQMVRRRREQAGVDVWPHRFRHHFSHTRLDRGGAEGDLMELNGWSSPQMLRRYGASARARRSYDRIMDDTPLPERAESHQSKRPIQAKYPPFGTLVQVWRFRTPPLPNGTICACRVSAWRVAGDVGGSAE
jgi:hypothetical protein